MTTTTTATTTDDMAAMLASLTALEAADELSPEPEEVVAKTIEGIDAEFDEAALLADLGAIGGTVEEAVTAPVDEEADLRAMLDAALAGINDEEPVTAAPVAVSVDEEIEDDLLADIVEAADRAENYEKQFDSAPVIDASDIAALTESVKKKLDEEGAKAPIKKRSKAPKTPAAPKAHRHTLVSLNDDVFTLTTGVPADKAAVLAATPTQVKIAEKFQNLFLSLHSGTKPSGYVVTAFELLNKAKTVTSLDIAGAYKASGLKDGTASSQTGQIMVLFNVAGIATRVGQTLTLREDSEVAAKLRKILNL